MFEKDDVLNDVFVNATAKLYRKGESFPHTSGMAFRLLSGKIQAVKCPRRDGQATERVFTAAEPGGCSVFVTNPSSDYYVLEDAKVFAFPREQAVELIDKLLEQNYCIRVEKGHVTLPPPAPEPQIEVETVPLTLPKSFSARPDPAITLPEMPAAKLRTRTPGQEFKPVGPIVPPAPESIQPVSMKPVSKRPTLLGVAVPIGSIPLDPPDAASIRKATPSRHPNRAELPFSSSYKGETKDALQNSEKVTMPRISVRVTGDAE